MIHHLLQYYCYSLLFQIISSYISRGSHLCLYGICWLNQMDFAWLRYAQFLVRNSSLQKSVSRSQQHHVSIFGDQNLEAHGPGPPTGLGHGECWMRLLTTRSNPIKAYPNMRRKPCTAFQLYIWQDVRLISIVFHSALSRTGEHSASH